LYFFAKIDRSGTMYEAMIHEMLCGEKDASRITDTFIQTFEPGCKIGPDHHPSMEVICVIDGTSYMLIHGQMVRINKGECFILFPDIEHSFLLNDRQTCTLVNVHFIPPEQSFFAQNLRGMGKEMRLFYEMKTHKRQYLKLSDNAVIRNISERIISESSRRKKSSEILTKLYLCELQIQLADILEDESGVFQKNLNSYLAEALLYIHLHYAEGIHLYQVAEAVSISPRHLSRLFREHFQVSVQGYINTLRLERAKKLLETTALSITEISQRLQFGNSQYFSSAFKKQEGISPGEYRDFVRISNNPAE
jgi:AraC-like DNA-binding protein/quercetin dioxygenase-like cupin family protein